MKKKIKGLLTTVTISTLLAVTVIAGGYTQTIEAMMNSIKIRVNGEYISGENIVYKGTSYAPLRIAGETLGKDIGWDQETNTATIDDKIEDSNLSDFNIPTGIPDSATLIEVVEEYKYHKYDYKADLPNGGYVTQITVSNAPGEGVYSSIVGYDGRKKPFLAFRFKGALPTSFSYSQGPNPDSDNRLDHYFLNEEMDKFMNAYDY